MKKLVSWVTIIVMAAAALVLPVNAFAESFYQPGALVEIMTEMTVSDILGSPSVTRLTVGPAQKDEKGVYIGFFNAEDGETRGLLNFFKDGSIVWEGPQATASKSQSGGLLIVSGISIPVDVLPVNLVLGSSESQSFEFQRRAGTRTFLDRINVTASPVSLDQARQSQWIKVEGALPPSLYMIEAVDEITRSLVVKQLWSPGSEWWLYEQTPFRRSWRIK